MSEGNGLPKGWAEATIEDIAYTATGGTPDRKNPAYFGGDIPWVKSGELGDGRVYASEESLTALGVDESSAKIFSKGTLCIALYGATVGKLGILEMDATTNQAVCGIFVPPEVRREYLFHYLTLIRPKLVEQGKGGAQSNISNGLVRQTTIPIAPLPEQHRIVDKIEELFSDLDAGVSALKRAKANLKRYRASVLKSAVEGRLTEEWRKEHPQAEDGQMLLDRILRERREKWGKDQLLKFKEKGKEPPKNWESKYEEPSAPATSELPELPEGWVWGSLQQILHGIEGGTSFSCLTRMATMDEWGVVKVSAMTWGTFLEDEQKALPPETEFDSSNEIKPGDMLLSRCNTAELVGASVLVGECRPRLLLSDKSLRLLVSESISRTWLHKVMSSRMARQQMSDVATGSSNSMRNISQDKIYAVRIPLPPLAEQEQIVALVEERLSQIDSAEKTIDSELIRSKRLRQSILKRAFEGKLVPQDPKDEPASVLLERIKASREADQPKKKAKKVTKVKAK
jgi:type I restriction enzyme S subunit